MDLISENKIGIVKGTVVEEAAESNFKGETGEVGLYLAMARQAQREGYPEIAEVLKTIAIEEAWHAAGYAELTGRISSSTKENLQRMLKGEEGANRYKRESAVRSKEAGIDEAHDFFDVSARDEARHARAIKGMLDRYFK
ncbi:rubrerythrin [Candidatus Methanoperedens nitroreducens]|uniref:Rubrerythrin n=1 Tax=Candidatus Methanoperedens nitratireducens TaxID=1392998 RepID=A0A062UV24_9EURY|nr:ferritin family protein [Candidatus Methanoperedens nitroreducens]KCZ70871.1 rubrerythrin [Candidatus Methanoperedens nitroreducens]MDJ1420726.1 ferritin family protein [Candidatus Methanoperedens sp.]